jgi:hypothetical protein
MIQSDLQGSTLYPERRAREEEVIRSGRQVSENAVDSIDDNVHIDDAGGKSVGSIFRPIVESAMANTFTD